MKYIPSFQHEWICPRCGAKNITTRRRTSIGRHVLTRCPACESENMRLLIPKDACKDKIEVALTPIPVTFNKLCKKCGIKFESPAIPGKRGSTAKYKLCPVCRTESNEYRQKNSKHGKGFGAKGRLERLVEGEYDNQKPDEVRERTMP